MNLSALILAGGKSSRMGCDKAWLEVEGQTLIARQIARVRQIGISAIFISGRADTDYSSLGYPVLKDEYFDAGPLAGIERGLAVMNSPALLVLAVDLPLMESGFLTRMAEACEPNKGIVPVLQGQLEPLSAIYSKESHHIAVRSLVRGRYAVQKFVGDCEEAGLLKRFPVAPADERVFLNWNTPEAYPANE